MFYFNSNKPQIFLLNTSCIRKPQVILEEGGGGGGSASPAPPRSAPDFCSAKLLFSSFLLKNLKNLYPGVSWVPFNSHDFYVLFLTEKRK